MAAYSNGCCCDMTKKIKRANRKSLIEIEYVKKYGLDQELDMCVDIKTFSRYTKMQRNRNPNHGLHTLSHCYPGISFKFEYCRDSSSRRREAKDGQSGTPKTNRKQYLCFRSLRKGNRGKKRYRNILDHSNILRNSMHNCIHPSQQ